MASRGTARTETGISHEGFLRHRHYLWAKAALLLCLAAILAYLFADVGGRPGGGTWLGYALGTIATLIILWLTLLGLRKRAMSRGRWSLKGWTSAHVWLGLSLVVIATLHTGLRFGWNVHSLAFALMILVILSGLFGIIVYAALPRALAASRGDMTRPQMIDALEAIDRQLLAAALPLGEAQAAIVARAIGDDPFARGPIRRLSASARGCRTGAALAALRGDPAATAILGPLERKSALLAQIRGHLRIKAWLEIWLYVHVPLTFALLAALAAHILSVFFYW